MSIHHHPPTPIKEMIPEAAKMSQPDERVANEQEEDQEEDQGEDSSQATLVSSDQLDDDIKLEEGGTVDNDASMVASMDAYMGASNNASQREESKTSTYCGPSSQKEEKIGRSPSAQESHQTVERIAREQGKEEHEGKNQSAMTGWRISSRKKDTTSIRTLL